MQILIAGDFCPCNRVVAAFEKANYASVLEEVQSLTLQANYSIVNLECPMVTINATPIEKEGPNLRCAANGVEALKYAGFNCVTLANNHFLDFGEIGVKETIDVLESHDIDHVGGGMNLKEASQILYKDFFGQRLAIVNCCEHEFSIQSGYGSNALDPIKVFYDIQKVKIIFMIFVE